MTNYIENLASNYTIRDNPIAIDLVLDGGAFNGFYQLGSLKLIKQLEKKGYLKVNKISGVSVGSISILNDFDVVYPVLNFSFRHNNSRSVPPIRTIGSDVSTTGL